MLSGMLYNIYIYVYIYHVLNRCKWAKTSQNYRLVPTTNKKDIKQRSTVVTDDTKFKVLHKKLYTILLSAH